MRPRSTFQNFVSQYNGWRMERQGLPLAGSGSVSPTTPKAFANYSPGLLQPWVYVVHHFFNSEGVPLKANTFSVKLFWFIYVPGLELATTLGQRPKPHRTLKVFVPQGRLTLSELKAMLVVDTQG